MTRGRVFTEDDRADGVLVAIINETAARRYWPGEDPIGKRFAIGQPRAVRLLPGVAPGDIEWREIVGVVADVRSAGFASEHPAGGVLQLQAVPAVRPVDRRAHRRRSGGVGAGDPSAIAAVNNRAVITRVRTLDDVADQSIADPRLRAELATLFSAVALMLGMLGIYGLMSYTVAQQTREIGIRMALGARRSQLARMILGKALRLAVAGVGLGLVGAYVSRAGSRRCSSASAPPTRSR